MIRTFVNSFKVSFAESANQFIYFLKRIPIIGKKVPDKVYRQTDAKLIIGIIREIIGVLTGFIKKSLYLGLMIILPAYLITEDKARMVPVFFHMFFFLSFILGPLMKNTIFNKYDKQAFNMITLMRVDAREYYITELIYKNLVDFVHFLLPTIIIGLIIGFSPLKAFLLVVELIALRFIGEWIQLWVYDHRKIILLEKNVYNLILYIGTLGLAYALPALDKTINFQPIIFSPFIVILIICAGILAFICLYKYKKYIPIAKIILTKDNVFKLGALRTEIRFNDVKLDEKKMRKEELDSSKYSNKEGYEYLNALFFLRHRRIMVLPVQRRLIIIGVMLLIGIALTVFAPHLRGEIFSAIRKSTPLLVFVMYSMSTGERICKAMFYNCDVSLLRYPYYREGKVILNNFTSRLKRVVLLNIIPALALSMAILIIITISGFSGKLLELLPLVLCIISLACFFSIHHLFMYYVIQPYTAELTVKSPLFKIVNGIIYIISYSCLQIKTSSYYFTIGIIAVTAIYTVVALIMTYKVAPKTFRLK